MALDITKSPFYQADASPDAASARASLERLAELFPTLAAEAQSSPQAEAVAIVVGFAIGARS